MTDEEYLQKYKELKHNQLIENGKLAEEYLKSKGVILLENNSVLLENELWIAGIDDCRQFPEGTHLIQKRRNGSWIRS